MTQNLLIVHLLLALCLRMAIKAIFISSVHPVCMGFSRICEESALEKRCMRKGSTLFSVSNTLAGLLSETIVNFVLEGEMFETGMRGQLGRTKKKGKLIL